LTRPAVRLKNRRPEQELSWKENGDQSSRRHPIPRLLDPEKAGRQPVVTLLLDEKLEIKKAVG
jgi:hypothetical protein